MANRTWCGDFSTGDLQQYGLVQCGGPDGSCPGQWEDYTTQVTTYWAHHQYRTTQEPSSNQPNDYTPSPFANGGTPDAYGYRFTLLSDPAGYVGNAIKLTTYSAGSDTSGDIWANGSRNEFVNAKEGGRDVDPYAATYKEGDERYYSLQTYFPDGTDPTYGNMSDPPDFGVCTTDGNGNCVNDAVAGCVCADFVTFFQFHEINDNSPPQ